MNSAQVAIAVRPGEHACACFAHAADWSRTAAAFLHGGIVSGRRVVYLYDGEDPATLAHDLVSEDDELAAALTRGQLELRIAQEAYTPDGRFDGERMIDVTWVLRDARVG